MFCSFQEFNTPAFYLSFRKSPRASSVRCLPRGAVLLDPSARTIDPATPLKSKELRRWRLIGLDTQE
jgi:hypothetical protein